MTQPHPHDPGGPQDGGPGASSPAPSPGGTRSPRAAGAGEDTSSWYRMAGIGFEFIVAVGLFGGIGWWLDRRFGTGPWLLIVGFGLGFAAGLFQMVRAANRMFR